jgi:hypothetical protein
MPGPQPPELPEKPSNEPEAYGSDPFPSSNDPNRFPNNRKGLYGKARPLQSTGWNVPDHSNPLNA